MKKPEYQFKTGAEGTWAALGIVVGYIVAQAFGVPETVAIASGVLARPVVGYLLQFVPGSSGV